MASFNNGQIILKAQLDQVASPGINEISLYNYNEKLYAKDGNGNIFDILNPSVSGASQDLSGYTLLATTSAISAGLDSRLTANSLVDSQQTNSINTLFSTYTNSSTVADISAGLSNRINNISSGESISSEYLPISGGTLTGVLTLKGVSNPGTALYSEAFGYSALQSSSGSYNTAIGYLAGSSLTIGTNNTLIGNWAGGSLKQGSDNVAIGKWSLLNAINESAYGNIAIGTNSMGNITSGSNNIAIGFGSLYNSDINNSIGNIAIGVNALNSGDGNSCIAIGNGAGINRSGSNNILIGHYAGQANIGSNQLWIHNPGNTIETSSSVFIFGNMTAGKLYIKGDRVATMSDLSSVSGGSQDLSPYTLLTTTSAISAGLQSQISAISGGSGGTPLTVTFGATTVSDVSTLNFVGVANVTTPVAGTATVTISGGSSGTGEPTVVTESGDTFTPDGLADVYDYTLTNTCDLSCPSSMPNGGTIIFKITQPSSAPVNIVFTDANGLTWMFSNGNTPVLTQTASAIDVITAVRIGSGVYVTIIKNFQ